MKRNARHGENLVSFIGFVLMFLGLMANRSNLIAVGALVYIVEELELAFGR